VQNPTALLQILTLFNCRKTTEKYKELTKLKPILQIHIKPEDENECRSFLCDAENQCMKTFSNDEL